MFCPNCGNDCGDAKFCSECGENLRNNQTQAVPEKNEKPRSIYYANVNGQEINLLKVYGNYGYTKRAFSHLKREYGISEEDAKELLAPLYAQSKMNERKPSFKNMLADAANEAGAKGIEKANRKNELERSGQVYCPKCLSTSISADKKGYGVGKAVVGAALFGGIGLTAGNIGAKKVICTCLKCGHQWQAGKK